MDPIQNNFSSHTKVKASQVVINCYDFMDRVTPECGIYDLTDGVYNDDPNTPYEEAQENQHNWLLDQAECKEGSKILEIGCGYGTVLQAAKKRGAEAIGITISRPQVEYCRAKGLDVCLLDYRNLPEEWNGYFDAIIANGCIEHFVQVSNVINQPGADTIIYKKLFELCGRVITPNSSSKKFVTTTIHETFTYENDPRKDPEFFSKIKNRLFSKWSARGIKSTLQGKAFGGYYPSLGQLAYCAEPFFKLEKEVDGTYDYYLTSVEWFKRARKIMRKFNKKSLKISLNIISFCLQHPIQGPILLISLEVLRAWERQFMGPNPPVKLLRQVWVAK
ncbi:MAG: class I SAM-dependent methyltransferase [bacterium]